MSEWSLNQYTWHMSRWIDCAGETLGDREMECEGLCGWLSGAEVGRWECGWRGRGCGGQGAPVVGGPVGGRVRSVWGALGP